MCKRTLLAGNVPIQRDPSILFAEQMRRNLGIDIEVNVLELGATRPLLRSREFDLATSGYALTIFDPDDLLGTAWGPGGRNYSQWARYNNPKVRNLIDRQSREPDIAKRKEILLKLEEYLLTVENPYGVWTWTSLFAFVSDKIKTEAGAHVPPITLRTDLKCEHLWLEE